MRAMRMIISTMVAVAALTTDARPETVERARYLMGSSCRIAASLPPAADGAALLEQAFAEVARWEGVLSDYDPTSELSKLNASGGAEFPASLDLLAFLDLGRSLAHETQGAFDLTVGVLVDLYRVRGGGRWPSEEELSTARAALGFERLVLDMEGRTARLAARGMRLDPGALGKGFALQAGAAILRSGGAGWALLDFGRQILVVGGGPGGCGIPVEVEPPAGSGRREQFTLYLNDASVSTSGNSERGLVVDGRPLGHIFDPWTAMPSAASSQATVIAADAGRADALSTALFVLGPEEGLRTARRLGVEAILWPADGSGPLLTPGLGRYLDDNCAARAPASPERTPALSQKGESR